MATGRTVCELDGVPTRLSCAGCGIPICPACQVRTAVGFKCRRCVGVPVARSRRGGPARLLAAGVAVLALAGGVLVLRPDAAPVADSGGGGRGAAHRPGE